MQIKKENTHEQILYVAKKLFLKKGFVKTSMRDIADGADVGLSNLYNYFKSKDELFRQIVAPLITALEGMVAMHHNIHYHEQFLKFASGQSDEMMTEHVQTYLQLIKNRHDELELLFFKSQGSTLENYVDEYTDECTRQVLDFMDDFKQRYPNFSSVSSAFTYHVHTVWMFNFIAEIIKHRLSPEETEKTVEDYILFEYTGWRELLNRP